MERVLIDELIVARRAESGGDKVTYQEVGDHVLKGDKGRMKAGKRAAVSSARRGRLIGRWNNGLDMTALKPRHLLRLAEFFGVTDITKLITE